MIRTDDARKGNRERFNGARSAIAPPPLVLHLLVPKTNIEIRPSLIKRSSFPFAIFVSFMKKDKREENSGISLPRNKHFPLFFLSFSFYNYRYYFFLHLGMVFLQEERKQERKRRF